MLQKYKNKYICPSIYHLSTGALKSTLKQKQISARTIGLGCGASTPIEFTPNFRSLLYTLCKTSDCITCFIIFLSGSEQTQRSCVVKSRQAPNVPTLLSMSYKFTQCHYCTTFTLMLMCQHIMYLLTKYYYSY